MSDFTASVDTPVAFMSESSNNSPSDSSTSYSSSSSSKENEKDKSEDKVVGTADTTTASSSSSSSSHGFRRWSEEEAEEIRIVRQRLGPLLTDRPQFPDVVGDRKIVRYLRGHNHDLDKVVEFMRNTLQWRDDNKMDSEARKSILHGGVNEPHKFPKGDVLTGIIPGIVIHHKGLDFRGCPVCVDTYNFSPGAVLAAVTQEEYINFMIYVFEFRSLILEQLSEEREQAELAKLVESKADPAKTPPYGVILQTCVIRDLSGIGLEFMGSAGKTLLRSVVTLASNNYPETLRKSFMIKTPWLFNTVWYFIKGFITTRTVDKVSILGYSFLEDILKEVDMANLPEMVGGSLKDVPGPFSFNLAYLDGA